MYADGIQGNKDDYGGLFIATGMASTWICYVIKTCF